ncbi:MAG: hypothetical protein KF850_25835 [Labilithrix sp.]|nr:hypothetical protein [Labilithrix sp.]MBX3215485.1 hypothetical protein [Labilithrix sp.]
MTALPYETIRRRITEVAPALEEGIRRTAAHPARHREGIERTLLRLLRARFGPLEAAIEALVAGAHSDDLDRWCERVLEAQRIDDVFDD